MPTWPEIWLAPEPISEPDMPEAPMEEPDLLSPRLPPLLDDMRFMAFLMRRS
eukprot:CAMPEP_0183408724 /NCGR_PEP_ID=MMETSP0370-20130417/18295_1 /TAXON_ID=268820 /ORGANISM="Peridinium aciculiferum, Strain PAER-2" /LENGTH=51 /DNA_ID=CAMNT_0025591283 /DNA_START=168 /DNA_END=319 /DNA_ORIENTATION=-